MGEVFLGEDQLLKRKVALKFLVEELAEDERAKKRFLREARAAAALDHPFICSVHDTGELEGRTFIAMEYMGGQTLKERLGDGPLPLKEALKITSEVTEALEKAHEAGIVHRDLKPANIMLTPDGHAKVMDFGLAKRAVSADASIQEVSSTLTREWSVVGTLSYMSPEQVKGENVDHRSDIFSLGIVLYEMLTGVHPFRKSAGAETISAILTEESTPLAESVQGFPERLQDTVSRMLAKNADERYQSVYEVRTDLTRLKEEFPAPTALAGSEKRSKRWLIGPLGATVGIAALASLWLYFLAPTSSVPSEPPVVVPLTSMQGIESHPSLSPDGKQVAFVLGHYVGGNIMVKQIGATEGVALPVTDSGSDTGPVWSADGSSIFFLRVLQAPWREEGSEGRAISVKVCSVPALGGTPREWANIHMAFPQFNATPYLTVAPDSNSLVVAGHPESEEGRGLYLLSLETREMRRLTEPPDPKSLDFSPCFSPDGRTLAFMRSSELRGGEIYTLTLDEGVQPTEDPERLCPTPGNFRGLGWDQEGRKIIYSSGQVADWRLWRVQISEPESPEVLEFARTGVRFPSVSRENNRLVFQKSSYDYNMYRIDLDESGEPAGQPQLFQSSSLSEGGVGFSPDGNKVVFHSDRNGRFELFVCDRDGSNVPRLISPGWNPSWSPDGKWIAFLAEPEGQTELYLVRAEGGAPKRLANNPAADRKPGWSADNKWVYFNSNRGAQEAVWKVPVGGGEVVEAVGRELGRSPDGQWLYFTSSDGSRVWRQPVRGGETLPVSEVLGHQPIMVRNKIYTLTADFLSRYYFNVYDLDTDMTTEAVFDTPFFHDFAIAPDGRSVLYSRNDHAGGDIMLVENFY
jgi:serine/threonine protein kinase/sugar lactone lactonase YvrE